MGRPGAWGSLVVAGAAQVGVLGADPVRGGGLGGEVTLVGQQVTHVAVAPGAQGKGALAGGLQPGLAIAARQAQQTQAGAVAVLGVLVGLQQPGDEFAAGQADALAPVDQARWAAGMWASTVV